MPRYSVPLTAGKKTRLPYPGKSLQLVDTGAATAVDVEVEWGGDQQNTEGFGELETGDGVKGGGETFGAVSLTSSVDTTVDLLVSKREVALINGQSVTATIAGTPTVHTFKGEDAGTPLFVSGTILGDTPCTSMTDNAAVPVDDTGATVLAADASRLEVVFFNQGPDPVALGKAGITWAKRAIVLSAGDNWIESRAAAQGWDAITAAGTTASVTTQERKA